MLAKVFALQAVGERCCCAGPSGPVDAIANLPDRGTSGFAGWGLLSDLMAGADELTLDARIIGLLRRRDGMCSEVLLDGERRITVWNIAWGYDLGDEYAHVTSNCSPFVGNEPSDFFSTSEVVQIREPGTEDALFARDM